MKIFYKGLFLLLISMGIDLNAQEIIGDWIKTGITYLNDQELSDNNPLKYQYLRYTFERNNKLFMSVKYDDRGTALSFDINANILQLKNSSGYLINSLFISKLSNDELVLIQKGEEGYADNNCIKYHFIKERIYQCHLPITPSDILIFNINDTVYKSSEKIYAKFSGDKSFSDFCREYLPAVNSNSMFLSTFIVRKDGIIDSIQILENINKQFEKQFRRALNKSGNLWIPGEFGGKKVDIQMKIDFKYFTSDKMTPMLDYSRQGREAMNNSDYLRALNYFDLALEKVSGDFEIIYYKAICELNLGNKKAACEDLEKVKRSGIMNVDTLIEQCCKQE